MKVPDHSASGTIVSCACLKDGLPVFLFGAGGRGRDGEGEREGGKGAVGVTGPSRNAGRSMAFANFCLYLCNVHKRPGLNLYCTAAIVAAFETRPYPVRRSRQPDRQPFSMRCSAPLWRPGLGLRSLPAPALMIYPLCPYA